MPQPRDTTELRQAIRQQLPLLRERYGVESLGIFGSYLRGEAHEGSDLDLLVRFSHSPSLFRYVEVENYLTDLLGVKVDLVMADSLKPSIGQWVLAEVEAV